MSVLKSRAFLLKSIRYSDSSRILTLFTEESGKIAAIHKGTRKNGQYGATGSYGLIEAVYYHKDTREVQTISSVNFLEIYNNIETDFERIRGTYVALELLGKCLEFSMPGNELFEETLKFMRRMNCKSRVPELTLLRFILKYSQFQGYLPHNESTNYETFFRSSGFTLRVSDIEVLRVVSDLSDNEYDNYNREFQSDLSRLCRICETRLLEHSLGSSFQKTRKVFDQL